MGTTWEHDAKTGTYRCTRCCTADLLPGAVCACPIAPPVRTAPAIEVAPAAASATGMASVEDDERDLREVRAAQRRNREWIRRSAGPAPFAEKLGFWARRMELERCRLVKDQLDAEAKTIARLLVVSSRRAERELRERERATAAALLAQGHGAN